MLGYITRRLALVVPVLLSVVSVIFVVVRVLPGDPAQAALGENASKVAVDALRSRLGLDAPLPIQYLRFLADLLRGDLGRSLINGASVRDQVAYNLPFTLQLSLVALLIGVLIGVPVGTIMATRQGSTVDDLGRVLSLAGLCVPAFVLGIMLMLLFGVQLKWLPTTGSGNPQTPADVAADLVLPGLSLGLVMLAPVARLTRAAMLETLGQEFVRTARAKGLHERGVLLVHALRPAAVPIASLTGVWAVALIGDSVTTEIVFARPGLGKMLVGAMLERDYTTLQSVMVIYTLFVVAINLVTDLVYRAIDPRIERSLKR